jgi:hypothetical protein
MSLLAGVSVGTDKAYFKRGEKVMRYTYDEMRAILKKYYNDDGFCGVASFCTATGLSVGKSFHLLKRYGRKPRTGTPFEAMYMALKEVGYKLETLDGDEVKVSDGWWKHYNSRGVRTYGQAEKALKKGTYFVLNATSKSAHVACIKDGVLNDWTARNKRKTVRTVLKVVKTEEQ